MLFLSFGLNVRNRPTSLATERTMNQESIFSRTADVIWMPSTSSALRIENGSVRTPVRGTILSARIDTAMTSLYC